MEHRQNRSILSQDAATTGRFFEPLYCLAFECVTRVRRFLNRDTNCEMNLWVREQHVLPVETTIVRLVLRMLPVDRSRAPADRLAAQNRQEPHC